MSITTINSQPAPGSSEYGGNNSQASGQDPTDLIFASLIQGVLQHKNGIMRYGEQLDLESRTDSDPAPAAPIGDNDDSAADNNSGIASSRSSDTDSSQNDASQNARPNKSAYADGTSSAPDDSSYSDGTSDAAALSPVADGGENGETNPSADVPVVQQGNVVEANTFAQAAIGAANANIASAQQGGSGTTNNSAVTKGTPAVTATGTPDGLAKPVVQLLSTAANNAATANSQGNSQTPANATVVSTAEPIVSQPVSNLSSNASLVAQSVSNASAAASAEEAILLTEQGANGTSTRTRSGQNNGNTTPNTGAGNGQTQPNPGAIPTGSATGETSQLAAALTTAQSASARAAATGSQPSQPVGGTNSISGNVGQSEFGAQVARATQVAPPQPPKPPTAPRPVMTQIAVQIQKAVGQGTDNISIRLNPPELGRVDVKLEISAQGRVSAMIAAEKPETLEMLQRDARGLQQALEDAGLKTDTGSLSFNLKGGGSAFNNELADNSKAGGGEQDGDDVSQADVDANAPPQEYASDNLVNVEV